jgi:hypothetical protein
MVLSGKHMEHEVVDIGKCSHRLCLPSHPPRTSIAHSAHDLPIPTEPPYHHKRRFRTSSQSVAFHHSSCTH